MSPVLLKGCNVAAFATDIFFNARYGKDISKLAQSYDHVALPKGPAFSIWGSIFLWELVFVIIQACTAMFDDILPRLTPWFCLSQLMQGCWVAIYTKSNPENQDKGGDIWFWLSTLLLIATPPVFLEACKVLAGVSPGAPYWISYGITMNTAWVLLAAGLTVNGAAVGAGLRGAALSATAILVLGLTVSLELFITGLIGSNPYNTPTAFFSVGIWALFWVFKYLQNIPSKSEPSEHATRILPLYGSTFVVFYKWCALVLLLTFVCLEVVVCMRKK